MRHHSTVPCMMKRSSMTPQSPPRSRINATFVLTSPPSNNSPLQALASYKIQDKKLRGDLRKELGMSSFARRKQTVHCKQQHPPSRGASAMTVRHRRRSWPVMSSKKARKHVHEDETALLREMKLWRFIESS
jgi:hypothetical protein